MRYLSLTDELINSICELIKTGSSFKNAYILSGVNHRTGIDWRSTALKDLTENKTANESIYIKLFEAMNKAKQAYIRSLVDCVTRAGKIPKHWQAAMTMVERIEPDDYSRFARLKQYQDLNINPQEDPPTVIISKVLSGIVTGLISAKEGEQITGIISALVKTDENTEIKAMLAQALQFRDTLKEGKKT